MKVSRKTLKILALLTSLSGSTALLIKSIVLFQRAFSLRQNLVHFLIVLAGAVVIGRMKGKWVMAKSFRKNLARIDNLEDPRIWQFYTPVFFFVLILMITAGVTLSRMAGANYAFTLIVGGIDLAFSLGLAVSTLIFWERKPGGD